MASSSERRNFFAMSDSLSDNVALIEWCEQSRRLLHAGALDLGISASELEAKLRRVSGGIMVAGLSSRYRAAQVAKPIQQASESLVIASRFIITASNRFQAAYAPELEAANYKPASSSFKFKGQ